MTIPHFTQAEFIKYLGEHGWSEIANGDWDTHGRIMIGDGTSFATFQLRKLYSFLHTVKLCDSIGIKAPPDHQLCYDQLMDLGNRSEDQAAE